ncbi:Speckle-type POZ protein [Araneus ventricosus]|uniref:Speckle-type POZ protein n=1 Tax=Araneus ventricosus TaxID=182803 RepID=A0A4Y2M8P4_ARAVE|nr:Speckle-type POZ protein [Araneus ventricosus]
MACNRKGFTIIWRIENYNSFFVRSGFGFASLPFVIDSVKHTSWKLRIVANSINKKGHIVFDVDRKVLSPVADLGLDFEISFFKEDNSSPLFEDSYVHTYCTHHESLICFVPHQKVYSRKGNEFIPPKTLTIHCTMFKSNGFFSEAGQCFARTRIRVERTAFVGFTERFSSLIPGERRDMTIKSASEKKPDLNLNLSLGGDLCCKEKVWIEIIPVKENYIKFCKCKLFLLGSEGMKIECARSEVLFSEEEPQDWKFPLNFTKGYLMKKNTEFLSNDTLALKCEFAFSTGIEYEGIEDSEFGNLAIVNKNQPRKFPSALEDMTCLYKEGVLCDMKLRTETETFNVHKNILSARSSVFKSMFTTDMKENEIDCVDIEDLDASTVRQMLLFLYSDSLEDLDWESAKNVYYAADKYNIVALKHRCSSFLKRNLQPSHCCELLLMSDRHQDRDLKKAVEECIAHNRDDILHTDQWVNLEKSNPVLVIETFRAMCVGK